MTAKTPSDFVGPNVRHFRVRRGWKQRELVERLHELGVKRTGWNQVKLHRLETGKTQKVTLETLFELALALDVSPLQLIVPRGDEAAYTQVWLGGEIARWTHETKRWLLGVQPVLRSDHYETDEEARAGWQHYWSGVTTLAGLKLFEEALELVRRAYSAMAVFEPEEEPDA